MDNIQVLQGLNLESRASVIKITLAKTESLVKILDLIQSFHPIFIEKYTFDEGALCIESNLTPVWREIAPILISLSKEEITYEKAKEKIVGEVIKERVASMSTIPLLYTAYKMGLETTPSIVEEKRLENSKGHNRIYTIGIGKHSEMIYSISSSKDSKIAKDIQRDKWQTNLMIQRMGLPIPKWQLINSVSEIEEVWAKYQKPVVIKPTGLTGGHGVVVGIKTIDEAKDAFKFAKKATEDRQREDWQTKIMIQEQVSGEDYRLLVINGKLEVATKRIPAFVVGDGKHTLNELIEITNTDPRRDTSSPAHTLKPIAIDEPLKKYIKEQGLTLDTIIEKNKKIFVRKVASMSQGGITEDFTDKVGPEIRVIVESIASSIHAFTLGVDVMCKDISKPLTKDNGAILEVNTMPEAYLNIYPVIGESKEYVLERYIKSLTAGNNTKQIVVIGHSDEDIPTLLRKKSILGSYINEKDVVGEYKDGEIIINGLDINKGLEKWQAIEGLKVNASLDAMIIHHRNIEDVKETGFGFNRIDLLMIESKYLEDREFRKTVRRYKFKGLISKIKKF